MKPVQVCIFDMDGVLVDVRPSYREVIRRTVSGYLEVFLGKAPGSLERLVAPEDVAALKLAPGFNNDWVLTTALVRYFLARLPTLEPPVLPPEASAAEVLACLRGAGAHLNVASDGLWRGADIPAFARQVAAAGGGLEGVGKVLGDGANTWYAFAEGDLCQRNLVKRMFQELYLGRDLFADTYGEAPLWHSGGGLIERETLFPSRRVLEALASRRPLAIATGRPRAEVIHAIEQFGLEDLFAAAVDLDDVEEAQAATGSPCLGKPHPFSLLEAARRAGGAGKRCAYVGDQPDDMRAARRAAEVQPFIAVGCVVMAQDSTMAEDALWRAGADVVIHHPDDLAAYLEGCT